MKLHENKTYEERLTESKKILKKYPTRACVFIKKLSTCNNVPNLDKNKFLVPLDLTMAQFIYIIRQRIRLHETHALFFYIDNNIIAGQMSISEIYSKYKSSDGFLYITYSGENCFG
jgi:GABA(A) receptor-associated protein